MPHPWRAGVRLVLLSVALGDITPRAAAHPWARRYETPGTVELTDGVGTADDGMLVVGRTNAWGAGDFDAWVVKLDAGGDIEWQEALGTSGRDDIERVQPCPSGGWIALGTTPPATTLPNVAIRLHADGSVAWAVRPSAGWLLDVAPLSNGHFVAVGELFASAEVGWIVELDDAGAIVDQQAYTLAGWPTVLKSVREAPSGDIYVGGWYFPGRRGQALLVRFDGTLRPRWTLTYRTASSGVGDVIPTPDDGVQYFMADDWVSVCVRANATGRPSWALDSTGQSGVEWIGTHAVASNGDVLVVAGSHDCPNGSGCRLYRLAPDGALVWVDDMGPLARDPRPVALPDGDVALITRGEATSARVVRVDGAGRADDVACAADVMPSSRPLVTAPWGLTTDAALEPSTATNSVVPVTLVVTPTFATLPDECDNCPGIPNDQSDLDSDGLGDPCDNCPAAANVDQSDVDHDATGDACDTCIDVDGDGLGTPGSATMTCPEDTCPFVPDALNTDTDVDGVGDACDNCPDVANADQADLDRDGTGDACQALREPSALDRGAGAPPLRVSKAPSAALALSWEDVGAPAYDVYRGTIASFARRAYDHGPIGACGITTPAVSVPDVAGNAYFLVTARLGLQESSYGRDSFGRERPASDPRCP